MNERYCATTRPRPCACCTVILWPDLRASPRWRPWTNSVTTQRSPSRGTKRGLAVLPAAGIVVETVGGLEAADLDGAGGAAAGSGAAAAGTGAGAVAAGAGPGGRGTPVEDRAAASGGGGGGGGVTGRGTKPIGFPASSAAIRSSTSLKPRCSAWIFLYSASASAG